MFKNLNQIYDEYVAGSSPHAVIYYEGVQLPHHSFDELKFEDIKLYFDAGGKSRCIPEGVEPFFGEEKEGQ